MAKCYLCKGDRPHQDIIFCDQCKDKQLEPSKVLVIWDKI
jgi:hypothetical protein